MEVQSTARNMRCARIISAILVAALAALLGCRSTTTETSDSRRPDTPKIDNDACQVAVRHYTIEDIPNGEIVRLFEQLAQKGDIRGKMWLARFYDKGRCSMPKRPELAQKMAAEVIAGIARLAERADPEAQFLLGAAYQEGLGVPQDFKQAREWLSQSANAGRPMAMNNLAFMLAWAHGGEPDINQARLLLSRAAELGSSTAVRQLSDYGASEGDDAERLKLLRSTPLVQAVGMQKNEGIKFLVKHGLISDPGGYEQDEHRQLKRHRFRQDGIVLSVDASDRITNVEGHAKGSLGPNQYRGEIPLGIPWSATGRSIVDALGKADDHGYIEADHAYGFAYRIQNVFFVVATSYEGERNPKLWRVYEKWAAKYAPPPFLELRK